MVFGVGCGLGGTPSFPKMSRRVQWSELCAPACVRGQSMTYEEIALELGITKQAVREIEQRALRKMRLKFMRMGLRSEFERDCL